MKHVYRVEFEERWKSNISGKTFTMDDSKHVLGNGDALKVVAKTRKRILGQRSKGKSEDGPYDDTCIGFKLIAIKQVIDIDF